MTALVTVYIVDVSAARLALWDVLSASERARADRFARTRDRNRFVLGAALLREVCARRTGETAATIAVDRTCRTCGAPHGRPVLAAGGPHVSVAHSGDVIAVACCDAGPVGVDVERVRPCGHEPLVAQVCAPHERASVSTGADFFRYWTRKESVVKATGDGLRVPLTSVAVTAPDRPPALEGYDGRGLRAAMADVPVREGYVSAVTVLGPPPLRVEVRDGAPLLAAREVVA